MIKAVLFDFDGVLTLNATGTQSTCNYISEVAGFDREIFTKEYRKYNKDLVYGRITHEEIWERLCNGINKKIDIQILYDSFIHTPINTEMIEIVKSIKNQGYATGLITDNKTDRMDYINRCIDLSKIFDSIIISSIIGSGKENNKIFHVAIEELVVKSSECIFIDNKEKNLIVPRRMGMEVIFFDHKERDMEKFKLQLRGKGIEV